METSQVAFTVEECQYIESVTGGKNRWWDQGKHGLRNPHAVTMATAMLEAAKHAKIDYTALADQLATVWD